jgi:hypothetical protein
METGLNARGGDRAAVELQLTTVRSGREPQIGRDPGPIKEPWACNLTAGAPSRGRSADR